MIPESGAQVETLPSSKSAKPIFVATVFKSGTKLLEFVISGLTGLKVDTPAFSVNPDYENAAPIRFLPGHFFSWHNVPNTPIRDRISQAGARPILLVRNIYDLAISQYFHFRHDVDAEIGHATGARDYFASMSLHEGISLALCGATSERFHWIGYGYYLRQTQELLRLSNEYPSLVVVYDRLVLNKKREIRRIAEFLDLEVHEEQIEAIVESSSLENMREARMREAGTGAHFRKGTPGDHVNVLAHYHYDMIGQLKLLFAPDLDALCRSLGYGDVTAMPAAKQETASSGEANT